MANAQGYWSSPGFSQSGQPTSSDAVHWPGSEPWGSDPNQYITRLVNPRRRIACASRVPLTLFTGLMCSQQKPAGPGVWFRSLPGALRQRVGRGQVAEFLSVHWERDRLTPHLESGAEGEQPPSSGPGSRPDQSSTSTAAQTLHSVLANAAPEGISESGTGRGAGRGTEPGGGWTLRREVERLSEQCAEAVRHTSAVVSSTLQPAARFLLLPAPPPAHSGALCVSHSSPCPDLPPEHQYLAFAASCLPPSGQAPAPASAAPVGGGAGGGSGGGGVQTPCVVRITFAEPEPREAERDPQAAPFCLEACALTLPEGEGVIDLAFCKGAELVLLTGSPAPDCRGAARLTVVPCEDLPFRPVLPRGPDLLHQCRQAGATAHLAAHLWRARDLNHGGALRPLAVSPRQIACTFVGSQRVVYYDLAEDEDSGEDEDMEEDD